MIRTVTKTLTPALLAGLLLTATGCSSDTSSTAAPSVTAAGAAVNGSSWAMPKNGAMVDVPVFAEALGQPSVTLLDVRTPEEFAAGHLEGAQNLDVNSPGFAAAIAKLPKDGVYAVYCRSGNRSGTAVDQMKAAGFTSTFHLGGGIGAWQGAGQPVVR